MLIQLCWRLDPGQKRSVCITCCHDEGRYKWPLVGPILLRALPYVLCTSNRRLLLFLQWQRLVSVLNVSILLYSLPVTPQQEPGGQQSLHPHGTPGMNTAGTDSHLSSETKAEAITKACRGVVVDTGCIYSPQELLCCVSVLWNTEKVMLHGATK